MAADRVEDAYRRIHHRLWHALLAYTADRDVASDAEAEAFSQALGRGDGVRDVDAWVWRTAFRVAGGLLQERRRRGSGPGGADERLPGGLPADRIEDFSVAEFVSQLGGLSDQQRAVVVLRYAGGFRPAEIAELLDTTPGSVRVQLHRAHAHLRATLEVPDGR